MQLVLRHISDLYALWVVEVTMQLVLRHISDLYALGSRGLQYSFSLTYLRPARNQGRRGNNMVGIEIFPLPLRQWEKVTQRNRCTVLKSGMNLFWLVDGEGIYPAWSQERGLDCVEREGKGNPRDGFKKSFGSGSVFFLWMIGIEFNLKDMYTSIHRFP